MSDAGVIKSGTFSLTVDPAQFTAAPLKTSATASVSFDPVKKSTGATISPALATFFVGVIMNILFAM